MAAGRRERAAPGWLDALARAAGHLPPGRARRAAVSLTVGLAKRCETYPLRLYGRWGPLYGDPYDHVLLRHYGNSGSWEAGLVAVLADALRGGGTLLDIGANIGLTSVPLARLPGVRIHAFEPEPALARLLRRNLASAAPGADVTLHPLALGEADGEATLHRSRYNFGDNRLGRAEPADRQGLTVPLRRLDDLLSPDELPRPLVIKLDVQGAEARVLAGGRRLFTAARAIAFEFEPDSLRAAGYHPQTFLADITAGCDRAVMLGHGHRVPPPAARPLSAVLADARAATASAGELVNLVCFRPPPAPVPLRR